MSKIIKQVIDVYLLQIDDYYEAMDELCKDLNKAIEEREGEPVPKIFFTREELNNISILRAIENGEKNEY